MNLSRASKGQREKILELLESRRGEWVPLPAILHLGIAQYNARIGELRREGYDIENRSEWKGNVRHSWFRFNGKREVAA